MCYYYMLLTPQKHPYSPPHPSDGHLEARSQRLQIGTSVSKRLQAEAIPSLCTCARSGAAFATRRSHIFISKPPSHKVPRRSYFLSRKNRKVQFREPFF